MNQNSGDSMGAADTDVVLQTIKDPMALYLRQYLMAGGIEVVGTPLKNYHRDSSFLRQLPERDQAGGGDSFLLWTSLVMRARHINTYQKSVRMSQH